MILPTWPKTLEKLQYEMYPLLQESRWKLCYRPQKFDVDADEVRLADKTDVTSVHVPLRVLATLPGDS